MNLTMLLESAAQRFGDRVLVGRRADGLTAAQLRRAALRGAELVREANAGSIIYGSGNGPGFVVALFAAAYAGVPLVPAQPRLETDELDKLFTAHPHALAIVEPDASTLWERSEDRALTSAQWLAVTTRTEGGEPDRSVTESDAPAVIAHTAGATSSPKGVVLRHAPLTARVLDTVEVGSAQPDEAALLGVPIFEASAVAHLVQNVYAGRRTMLLKRPDAEEWLETVRAEGITSALVVPALLARILDSDDDKSTPSLRTLEYGGAPMPPSLIQSARARWPSLDFVHGYWLAELSSTVAELTRDDYQAVFASWDPFVRARLGSVGRPVPGVEIQIRNSAGTVVDPGERGRIWIRGAHVWVEYIAGGPALGEDGFFDTRDVGFFDEDGYLFISGRSDDAIVTAGESIAPWGIEAALRRHPAVSDVAVVGLPDAAGDQQNVAVVVLRSGMQVAADDLRRYVRAAQPFLKGPDEIVFWMELPRTATGKLVRRNIVDQLRALAGW
ncbi:class I adenylate-forming enzyme family protein [Rhodococcus sp. NPDC003318]|uniref:class I adenylate-forming enzyme family protein n=1 Tax=Rhodococcus sp. NPDC003318 TaxID=3364503 RepID=UPI0036B644C9